MKKIKFLSSVFITAISFLAVYIFYVAVIQNGNLSQMASDQRTYSQEVKRWRGCIYDCNMIPLCDRSEAKSQEVYGNTVPVTARYTSESIAGHILGYVDSQGNGIGGMEGAFDNILHTDGKSYALFVRDAVGTPIWDNFSTLNYRYAPQSNIKTTLDYKIQKIAENAASKYIKSGSIVILDTQTFDIKAMVSRPEYNQNNIADNLNDEGSPLLNKALCSYNAGSIFKIITTAAALECGIDGEDFCGGGTIIDGVEFLCHNHDGHGQIDFKNAFAKSCNVYFYGLGQRTGGEKIIDMAQRFGLGNTLININIDQDGGTLPQREYFTQRECANISIGQGEILVTPLQAAYITAVIANDGIGKSVNIADSIVQYNGTETQNLRSDKSKVVISKSNAIQIGSMMRECVLEGTAQGVQNGIVAVAGKTGSAETGWMDNEDNPMVHGWFCGYFPYENPRYAMAVFVENGKSGSTSCIPPFREIVLSINEMYNVN